MPYQRPIFATLALSASLLLTGCDTLGLGSAEAPAPVLRTIDYLNDDLASLVFALDVPANVEPVAGGTLVTLAASAGKGQQRLDARPVLTDGDAAQGILPAPETGRTYYFLGFSDKDKTGLANMQKWARNLPSTDAPVFALSIVPRLCASSPVDPSATQVAVLAFEPGAAPLAPIIAREALARALGASPLSPCAGR